MEIKLFEIPVRDVFDGYENNEETGQVVAYGGKLNVRPAYQREFVYDDKKKVAVMNSILHQFPLNVMYWSENEDGTYEMLDGQQRTISICDWLDNGYSIFAKPTSPLTPYYAHTSQEITERVLDYKLMIYICKGTDTEKLDWFKIINIAGEKADRSGAAQRYLYRSLAERCQEIFLQESVYCLPNWRAVYERHSDPPGLFGDGVDLDCLQRGKNH